jgi:energy-coupling factor transporter ATP-binding protein EcfA2
MQVLVSVEARKHTQKQTQTHTNTHSQIIQLFDTMEVRFGVVIVGPSGGGKSQCYRTLQGALTHLKTNLNSNIDAHQVGQPECFCISSNKLQRQ